MEREEKRNEKREMTEMNSYYPAGGEGNKERSEQGPQKAKDGERERRKDGKEVNFKACL